MTSIGETIGKLRRERGMTREHPTETLRVSSQTNTA